MANMTPSYAGQANATGAADALFLKVFSGEILTAFRENNVFQARTMTRTISSGKSAQFPATWKASAGYHTPGTQLVGTTISGNERVITIDDLLVSSVFIASIDEAKSHFEFRSEYSFQAGASLSKAYDQNLARVGILAARASATVSGANGGSQIVAVGSKTNADTLIAAVADAAQAMDEKDVPANDRALFVTPDTFYNLINSGSKAIHTDYNPQGNGSVAEGKIYKLFGFDIVKTNNLPQTDQSALGTIPTTYRGNFANTTALAMQKGAVGTVKLMDLAVESQYLIEYQGTLIVAKYAVGHGILRPECAVEIANA